ncbi:mannose-1-phosphate guanylyltransferase, partial [uncultured Porphyromonas sp.]|uniref:mannose-1-phosphate guanylyltransferase n=1 Tax=uncultured Porphyromonas sp. TaxID=159274 RepID=UPI0025CD16F2
MVHTHAYGVLMAGGIGSRFWPMSRREQPKQFLDILDEGRTMIRSTAFRLEAVAPASHFYVVTGQLYQDEVLRQLPYLHPSQVLTEPVGRNTAPCIAYAAYRIYAEDPEAIMVVCPSDHHIDDAVAYQRVLHQAITYVAEHDVLMTIGIEPTYPATGYGYIELTGEPDEGVYRVARFKEKPELEEAERLIARGNHLWNAGIFVWKAIDII